MYHLNLYYIPSAPKGFLRETRFFFHLELIYELKEVESSFPFLVERIRFLKKLKNRFLLRIKMTLFF